MKIQMTRAQFDQAAAHLKQVGVEVGGDQGTLSHSGVTIQYAFNGTALSVTVVHKPFFVSESYVEDQITAWFAAGLSGK